MQMRWKKERLRKGGKKERRKGRKNCRWYGRLKEGEREDWKKGV